MSVEFQSETLPKASDKVQNVLDTAEAGKIPGTKGKHPLAEVLGTSLTGGLKNAGTKGYLAVRAIGSN